MTRIVDPLANPDDEAAMINRAAVVVALNRHKLDDDYGPEQMETMLRYALIAGTIDATKVVTAAEAGDAIADAALRHVAAKMPPFKPAETLTENDLQIISFGRRAVLRGPGRQSWSKLYYRHIAFCVLIHLACGEFGIRPTRALQSRSAKRKPSGCSVIAAALARNGIHIAEASLQVDVWFGIPGKLFRSSAALAGLLVEPKPGT
jgi:hypothetical protein